MRLTTITLCAAMTLTALVAISPASAGGGHRGRHHGGHHYGFLALPLIALFAHSLSHSDPYYRSAPPPRHYHRPCHRVEKDGYDAHGAPVRLGGTMCYDSYGAPYIAPGSRHIIGYY